MHTCSRITLLALTSVLYMIEALGATVIASSGDAYVRREGNSWIFGTSRVEKRIALENGQLTLTSFVNKRLHTEYRDGSSDPAEIRFKMNGRDISSPSWRWELRRDEVRRLKQRELQLDLELRSEGISAIQHYLVYPGTSLIREWLSIRNDSRSPAIVSDLYFLNSLVLGKATERLQLHYITGGGNFNGSQLLKTDTVSTTYSHTFDSYKGIQKESYSETSFSQPIVPNAVAYHFDGTHACGASRRSAIRAMHILATLSPMVPLPVGSATV